jgi:hypothetical protein
MITFDEETYAAVKAEAGELLAQHEAELNGAPDKRRMRLNDLMYLAAEAAGRLHILTARDDGVLVGYFVSFIAPHTHYADTLCALEDGYYLARSHRKGLTGVRLIREWARRMKARGDVQELYLMTKLAPHLDHGVIFERLGFKPTDTLYRQWIGD